MLGLKIRGAGAHEATFGLPEGGDKRITLSDQAAQTGHLTIYTSDVRCASLMAIANGAELRSNLDEVTDGEAVRVADPSGNLVTFKRAVEPMPDTPHAGSSSPSTTGSASTR